MQHNFLEALRVDNMIEDISQNRYLIKDYIQSHKYSLRNCLLSGNEKDVDTLFRDIEKLQNE